MAKKLDLDINTDSFLESIRPEMPPSSSQKKEKEEPEVKTTDTVKERQRNIHKSQKAEMNLEDEFMELFKQIEQNGKSESSVSVGYGIAVVWVFCGLCCGVCVCCGFCSPWFSFLPRSSSL